MSRKLLAGTVLLGASILALVFGSRSSSVYSRSVSEFLARPIRDRPVRIIGTLVHGSLCRASRECDIRFRLVSVFYERTAAARVGPSPELSMRYETCILPDRLRDTPGVDLPVTVEGELCASCHRFEVSQVMIKTPGPYRLKADETPPVQPAPIEIPPCS